MQGWRYVKIKLAYSLSIGRCEFFLYNGRIVFLHLPRLVPVETVRFGLMGVGVLAGLGVIQQRLNRLFIR
jgi:hypothetical protein